MSNSIAVDMVMAEIVRAKEKWPGWPRDPVHAAAVVAEESGELVQAALGYTYSGGCSQNMLTEAIHTAATALRFIEAFNAGHYSSRPDDLDKA